MQFNIYNIIVVTLNHLEINQISALNNSEEVDMLTNKSN